MASMTRREERRQREATKVGSQAWMQEQLWAFNRQRREDAARACQAAERERNEMARQQQKVNITLSLVRMDLGLLDKTLEVARGAMAKHYHPDVYGGSGVEMRRINALIDDLRQQLRVSARMPNHETNG
jgi:hypothetical protein